MENRVANYDIQKRRSQQRRGEQSGKLRYTEEEEPAKTWRTEWQTTIYRRGGASKDVENIVANYDIQKRRSQQRRGEQSGKLRYPEEEEPAKTWRTEWQTTIYRRGGASKDAENRVVNYDIQKRRSQQRRGEQSGKLRYTEEEEPAKTRRTEWQTTIYRRGGASKDPENRVANYDIQKRRSQQRRGEQSGKLRYTEEEEPAKTWRTEWQTTIYRRGGASKDVENRVANYDIQKRRSQQRRGEQSGKGMVEMESISNLTGVICDKKVQTKMMLPIPESDSTDVALRLRNMTNVIKMESVWQQQLWAWCAGQWVWACWNTEEIEGSWRKHGWNRYRWSWEGEGWNGSGTLKEEMKQKTSGQL